MAGSDARFPTSVVRQALRGAMTMGLPDDADKRATFKWTPRSEYATADSGGNPFDWSSTPEETQTWPDVQIPVAVEMGGGPETGTAAGLMEAKQVTLTILDEDYAQIVVDGKRADVVELDGATYDIKWEAPAMGLFDLTVHTIYAVSRDEA